ncbi:carboxy-S-adenosyl-L-methionine synthase CmoA [Saccharospirillum sp. MSK14-1]|uniref:carboxy-S-adenosyl-L-methionine synthase CmoA n=1 Tax=Saccharospirillum sp. MSK14-1 TaxID=1897632 RepID=UPI000D38BDDC|nr:carboxy-S-adenosyl-L-methionine synthase CmoA [Saccharospirillum sp. MSK14-1]PTY37365.1 carboxy-S-adenosyl-L-methionine synthase CmoA [Saccharospirillum sp. MSK14-1]
MPHEKDTIYASDHGQVADFRFDEQVARVFPDMIKRSVPGYSHIIAMIGVLAEQYAQPDSQLYDLGSSLGAASLAMRHRVHTPGARIIAVDNSQAMLDRSRDFLDSEDLPTPVHTLCADITNLTLERASFVVLNFTLQFVPLEERQATLQRIYDGMLPGGALVLSEKLRFEDPVQEQLLGQHHHDFKRANGYSDLEISQKRQAIERVLLPESADDHLNRLHSVGFQVATLWYQSFNFASFLAIK